MRKFIVAATLAALGVALFAVPASASFDRHFRVYEKAVFHETANGFRFKGKLFDPGNRHNRVGRDRGRVKIEDHPPVGHVRGVIRLNGEIGGRGKIKYRGNIRRNDNRLIVVGGTGDFNGVAGKVVFHNVNRIGTKTVDEFDLVR